MDLSVSCDWSVEEWLRNAGLNIYATAFVDNGYDTETLCADLKGEDLDAIGVTNKKHRTILFTQAKLLREKAGGLDGRAETLHGASSPPSVESMPTYSEPWRGKVEGSKQNGVIVHAGEVTDGQTHRGLHKKRSGEIHSSKPAPPIKPRKQVKVHTQPPRGIKHPLVSPDLPPYQKDGPTGLTRLQLKLKIREELQKDRIILSEAPYTHEDGSANENLMVDLAEKYAGRFELESLNVFDALKDVWRHAVNKSKFVLGERKVGKDEPDTLLKQLSVGNATYDEPFDSTLMTKGFTQPPSSRKITHEDSTKSKTMPANGLPSQKDYDEPFDSVVGPNQPMMVVGSRPEPPPIPPRRPPSAEGLTPESSPEERKRSSGDQKSPHTSPKPSHAFRLFRRKQKPRSHSVKEVDLTDKGKAKKKTLASSKSKEDTGMKKHGSAENILPESGIPLAKSTKKSKRASVPTIAFLPPVPPLPLAHTVPLTRSSSSSVATSESDDSPHVKKKGSNFLGKFHSPPTLKRTRPEDIRLRSGSLSDREKSTSLPRLAKMKTTSELELVKETDAKKALRMSQSHEELRDTFPDNREKQKKEQKGNFIKRLFKRKNTPTSSRRHKERVNRGSTTGDTFTMSSSKSLPDIAGTTIHRSMEALDRSPVGLTDVGYTEVFDAIKPEEYLLPQKPPRLPPPRRSPIASPDESPLPHRRILIKSSSESSATDNLIIPIHAGSAPVEARFMKHTPPGANVYNPQSPEIDEINFSDGFEGPGHFRSDSKLSGHSEEAGSRTEESCSCGSRPSSYLSNIEDEGSHSRNSRHPSTGSSTSIERGSVKPPPPPKPKSLLTKRKPSPPSAQERIPKVAEEGQKEAPLRRPPPKPARSKYRSLRIETKRASGLEFADGNPQRKSQTFHPRTSSSEERSKSIPPLEKSGSEGNILHRVSAVQAEEASRTGSVPSTPDEARKPKPLPKPRTLSKPTPPAKPARTGVAKPPVESVLSSKLLEESIDLTQPPYSTVWGEGGIPYHLITRYAEEVRSSEETVATTLDNIRRKQLHGLTREFVPMKREDWDKGSYLHRNGVESTVCNHT